VRGICTRAADYPARLLPSPRQCPANAQQLAAWADPG